MRSKTVSERLGEVRRVYLVDDDAPMRQSLFRTLTRSGYDVRGYAGAHEFIATYDGSPGCLIVDLAMPRMRGEELVEIATRQRFNLVILVLTGHATIENAVRLGQLGALAVVEKPVSNEVLLAKVEEALRHGRSFFSKNLLATDYRTRIQRLTKREREVLPLIVAGLTSAEIATTLDVKRKTVENHRRHLMKKMDAANTIELATEYALFCANYAPAGLELSVRDHKDDEDGPQPLASRADM